MRLLHTSDWHLGKVLGRIDRSPDLDEVIAETVGIAQEFAPDLIVHSGDLFDHARPGAPDLHRAFEALGELSRVAPVVVIAGNHDSPSLFAAFQRLLDLGAGDTGPSAIRLVPHAKPPAAGGILSFPAASGSETIRLAPLPFVHPGATIKYFDVDPSKYTAVYTDQVKTMAGALARELVRDVSTELGIMAAHLYIDGAIVGRSERTIHVSETYATRAEHLPLVTYAAFGHIHKPQSLPGGRHIHYAGSPIPIDFGEVDEKKRVILVEARPGGPPTIESTPLKGGRPLKRLDGTLEVLMAPDNDPGKAIVDVLVETEVPIPDLAKMLSTAWPRTTIRSAVEKLPAADDGLVTPSSEGHEDEPAVADLLRDFLIDRKIGGGLRDQLLQLFQDVHGRVGTAEELPAIPELQELMRCSHGSVEEVRS